MSTATTPAPPEDKAAPPVQLYYNADEQSLVDANLAVRWCIHPGLIDDLKSQGINEAFVLLVASQGNTERGRWVVPLLNEMAYLQFEYKGEHLLRAAIVYDHSAMGRSKVRRELLAQESSRTYKFATIDHREDDLYEHFGYSSIHRYGETAEIEIKIDSRLFAKEPSKFYAYATNFFWKTRPRNQCRGRERFTLELAFFWILIPAAFICTIASWLATVVLWGGMALLGIRGLHRPFSSLRHPWRYGPVKLVDDLDPERSASKWYYQDARGHIPRNAFFWVVNPFTVVIVLAIFGIASLAAGVKFVFIGLGILVVAGLIMGLGGTGLAHGFDKLQQWLDRKARARNALAFEQYYKDLASMACNGTREASVSALPRQRRTMHLRYQATKAKVCKPFARQ